MSLPVAAIFDVGRTNKKLFLFNESYQIVFEKSEHFQEVPDEDGDLCEDINSLKSFIQQGLKTVLALSDFKVRAVNFSAYGASLVYLDDQGNNIGPLYNYLKPYPEKLKKQFYDSYGGESLFSFETASPVLGSLNSGMQLYRLKYEKPELYSRINYALHLPQYLSYLVSGKAFSEITSIGCHTNLWHFQNHDYHYWVKREGLLEKFPPVAPSDMLVEPADPSHTHSVGIGLHDSSSALIPYLVSFKDPFVLISTGTWAISLNPFSEAPLTREELECDCLCYLQYRAAPVKASRLFAGPIHDVEVERIAKHFNHKPERYFSLEFDIECINRIDTSLAAAHSHTKEILARCAFSSRDLSQFSDGALAYHQLIFDLMVQQHASTRLVTRGTPVRKIFVDGGFGNNKIYMNMLAAFFPEMQVFASSIPQASAIGAALAIHEAWNAEEFPRHLITLKHYTPELRLPIASASRP